MFRLIPFVCSWPARFALRCSLNSAARKTLRPYVLLRLVAASLFCVPVHLCYIAKNGYAAQGAEVRTDPVVELDGKEVIGLAGEDCTGRYPL